MAFNGKYVSIRQIIEKTYRDSGLDNIDFESAIEWSAELMGLIGVPYFYIEKSTNNADEPVLQVLNYRVELPVSFVDKKALRRVFPDGDGNIISSSPMVESMDIYHATNMKKTDHVDIATQEFSVDIEEDLVVNPTTITVDQLRNTGAGIFSYKMQNGYIYTNFETGYIEMVYKSHPVDNEGYLLIPDDEKYKQALKWFITYKIDMINFRRNPASPGMAALINRSEQEYLFYVAAARNKAHIPSIDKMEAIKNMWVRTIPKFNEHAAGFKSTNIQEMRYNQRAIRRNR